MLLFNLPLVVKASTEQVASPFARLVAEVLNANRRPVNEKPDAHHETYAVGTLDHYIDSRVCDERFRIG